MVRYRGRHAAMRQGTTSRRRRALSGRRLRRGLGGTAVAALVMAALTASQAPGVELGGQHDTDKGRSDAARDGTSGDDSYHTELPPLETPNPPGGSAPGGSGDQSGIPASVLDAYKKAAKSLASSSTGCGLRWEVLAAIGKVESGQARGGAVDEGGTTLRPILGPVLNGQGFASIKDTDGGKWDDDSQYDRAVGPMQFIPSTWNRWGADGNGDGREDPNNVFDAALAAGAYLCADGRDLTVKADLDRAILSYNNSSAYLRTVLAWFDYYRKGAHSVPDGEGALPTSPGAGGGSAGDSSPGSVERTGSSGKGGGKSESGKGGSGRTKPGNGGPNGGSGGGGGGGGHSPSPTPTPTAPSSLKRVGAGKITAAAGESFAQRPQVKVAASNGKGVKGVHVRFEVRGETGAGFAGGIKSVAVATNSAGLATAPTLHAGDRPGSFTVRASAPGKGLDTVDFGASVTAPRADALARTGDAPLEAEKNGVFVNAVEVKATRGGKAAPGVLVTAALADTAKGPFFKDADGKPLRTLQGLKTDADGVLRLPALFADANPGAYTLTLTATGGAKLEVELTIKG